MSRVIVFVFVALVLACLLTGRVEAQGVYPNQFVEQLNPDNSNWEFYSQKGGTPRRASFDNIRKYIYNGLGLTLNPTTHLLKFTRQGVSDIDLSLAPYMQTLTVGTNGLGQTTVSISGGNTITLPSVSNQIVSIVPPLTGDGAISNPLGILNLGITGAKIASNTLTFDKVQSIPTLTLLGRYTTGTGDIQTITLGTNLSLTSNGVLNAAGGSGGGAVTDGIKGDIEVSGTGTIWTVRPGVITSGKIATGAVGPTELAATAVTAGTYTAPTITVDADGRITAASSGSPTLVEYANGDAIILATGTGITCAKSGGTATLTIPSGVRLVSISIRGTTADLDGSQNFTIQINANSAVSNLGNSTLRIPQFQIINTASQVGGGPSPSLPFIYDEGSTPQRQVTGVGSGNITLRAINMNSFSNWVMSVNL